MSRIAPILACFAVAISWPVPVPAAAAIWFVSPLGNDSTGDGSFQNPFRTMQRGIGAAGDKDIVQLGGGAYGPGVINNKSLTITSPGGAVIGNPSGPAITFNGGPADELTLRDVTINQGGTANNGIQFNGGRKLNTFNVTIQNGSGGASGINFRPSTNSELNVGSHSIISNYARGGVNVTPRNGADVVGTISDSYLLNHGTGVRSVAGAGSNVSILVTDSSITGGGTGILSSGAGSLVVVNNSTVTHNAVGVQAQNSGQTRSRINNTFVGNVTDGSFDGPWPVK